MTIPDIPYRMADRTEMNWSLDHRRSSRLTSLARIDADRRRRSCLPRNARIREIQVLELLGRRATEQSGSASGIGMAARPRNFTSRRSRESSAP